MIPLFFSPIIKYLILNSSLKLSNLDGDNCVVLVFDIIGGSLNAVGLKLVLLKTH